MKIIALVKEVPDPEGIYALDGEGNVLLDELPRLFGVFDENALEAAVQLKDEQGAFATALSYGRPESDKSLIHALAMGADEAALVEDEEIQSRDARAIAAVLAAAVRKLGPFDLILSGREASDTGAGLVGPLVAHLLGIPFLTLVIRLEVVDEQFRITRLAEDGHDVFAANPPMLLTVSNQMNFPRYPSVLKFLQARKKPILRWPVDSLGVDLASESSLHPLATRRYQPSLLGNCRFAEGLTLGERVEELVRLMREGV